MNSLSFPSNVCNLPTLCVFLLYFSSILAGVPRLLCPLRRLVDHNDSHRLYKICCTCEGKGMFSGSASSSSNLGLLNEQKAQLAHTPCRSRRLRCRQRVGNITDSHSLPSFCPLYVILLGLFDGESMEEAVAPAST